MESTNPEAAHRQPLPVLKHSGKVEQLKQETQGTPDPVRGAHDDAAARSAAAPAAAAAVPPPPPALMGGPLHTSTPGLAPAQRAVEATVVEVIRGIYDPEIPVNIYDLGLIYEIHVDPENRVKVKMTLTAPACPVAGELPAQVEQKIEAIPEVKSADVELVWEPAWDKSRMSEAAMLDLGLL